jgi:hypothetical protein
MVEEWWWWCGDVNNRDDDDYANLLDDIVWITVYKIIYKIL